MLLCVRNVRSCFSAVLTTLLLLHEASAKGSSRTSDSGTIKCPCFCSAREDSESLWATFWADEYELVPGESTDGPPVCGSGSCRSAAHGASVLSFCGRFVTYPFCERQLQNRSFSLADLDDSAKLCVLGTPWTEGTGCWETVARGACAFAFPRCVAAPGGSASSSSSSSSSSSAVALPVCKGQCVAERTTCRTWGSAFGSKDTIRKGCAGSQYLDAEAGSALCSAAAPSARARAPWELAGPALAAAVVLLACGHHV